MPNLNKALDRLVDIFATVLARRLNEMTSKSQKHEPHRAVSRAHRICPVPKCGQPGNGPRNRWFCKEHAKAYSDAAQIKILAARNASLVSLTPKTAVAVAKVKRVSPLRGMKLNMRCRASDHCFAISKGPKYRFMCEEHLKTLSVKEQKAALAAWHKGHPFSATFKKAVPPTVRNAA